MKRKFLSLLLCVALVLPFAACKGAEDTTPVPPPALAPSEQPTVDGLTHPTAEDSATIRWLNATYAPYTLDHGTGDYNNFGGGRRTKAYVKQIAAYLKDDWGVTDTATAKDLLQWLRDYGQRGDYIRAAKQLEGRGFLTLSEADFLARVEADYQYDSATASAWLNVARIYKAHGDHAIDAWNSSLVIRLSSYAYIAGYLTFEEAVDEAVVSGLELQQAYTSWDDMMQSYLLGYSFFLGRAITGDPNKDEGRFLGYDRLKKETDNPYTVDWNTLLEPMTPAYSDAEASSGADASTASNASASHPDDGPASSGAEASPSQSASSGEVASASSESSAAGTA